MSTPATRVPVRESGKLLTQRRKDAKVRTGREPQIAGIAGIARIATTTTPGIFSLLPQSKVCYTEAYIRMCRIVCQEAGLCQTQTNKTILPTRPTPICTTRASLFKLRQPTLDRIPIASPIPSQLRESILIPPCHHLRSPAATPSRPEDPHHRNDSLADRGTDARYWSG